MKLDDYTVGKRYGKAIFELAQEHDLLENSYEQLARLRKVYTEVPELGAILTDVRLDQTQKQTIFAELVSAFDGLIADFLRLVFDYRRMNDVVLMIDEFDRRYYQEKKIIIGTVTTAIPLEPEQKNKLENNFAERLGYHAAHLQNLVDPEIIGGAITIGNGLEIDGSVRSQLEAIRQSLLR